jgi:hypothetical protein
MTIATLRPENLIPYITTTYAFTMEPSVQKSFTIFGINFLPGTVVTIPGFDGTIDLVTIVSPEEMEITVTSGVAEATYDLVLTNRVNNLAWTGNGVGLLKVHVSTWVDLRTGGDVFTDGNGAGNDIRYRVGAALVRDSDGMHFTGYSPFGSWVKFESLGWTRGQEKTLEWVMTKPTSSMMIGIGSDETDEGSSAQYNQMENVAYIGIGTLGSLYGNNGTPGTTGYHTGINISLSSYTALKMKFTLDGRSAVPTSPAGIFTLYGLPSLGEGDWDNIANVLGSVTIGGTLAPDAANIMPAIIPTDGGAQRFTAIRIT